MNLFRLFLVIAMSLLSFQTFAQVGIGTTTPHKSAVLDIQSQDHNTGARFPVMTKAECYAISSPATGLMVYVKDAYIISENIGGGVVEAEHGRVYLYDGRHWVEMQAYIPN